ncbi:MAG: hypothetical protein AAF564_25380 [Bacteroidota bacterium]
MGRKFSKEEAERIFSLAAERQQAKRIDEVNQLSLAELEEAGLAAGIDPAFIREAAGDLLRPDRATEQRDFMGFPVELRESHVLPIAFDDQNWKQAVDIFTGVYNKPGLVTEIGTTRRWQSEPKETGIPVTVIAEKESHGTRFTIEKKTWPMTLGFGIGSVVNVLMGLMFGIVWLSTTGNEELVFPAGIMMGIGLLLGVIGGFSTKAMAKQDAKHFENVFRHLNNLAQASEDEPEEREAAPTSSRSNHHNAGKLLDNMDEIQDSNRTNSGTKTRT